MGLVIYIIICKNCYNRKNNRKIKSVYWFNISSAVSFGSGLISYLVFIFLRDLETCKKLYQKQKNDPPILRNLPPVSHPLHSTLSLCCKVSLEVFYVVDFASVHFCQRVLREPKINKRLTELIFF